MPKKTKRQKLLAQLHRQINPGTTNLLTTVNQYQFRVNQNSPQSPLVADPSCTSIFTDLRKTLILAIFTIVVEFGLFVLIKSPV